jgi:Endonuclease/Exonuclease/phosphatase family
MLGLCEVDEASVDRLRRHFPATFGVKPHVQAQGLTRWDLALAYNQEVWALSGRSTPITVSYQRQTYRAGYRTKFRHVSTDTEVAVYLAHWRSRLNDGRLARERCAEQLRQRIVREKVHVLLMGDFNDEPFDKALENLNATRDMHLARERPGMLFNPFWRHLGHEDRQDPTCGTYYHRNGDTTRWRTFDQILMSAGFLGNHGLIYDRTRVVRTLENPGSSNSRIRTYADHLPVAIDLVVKHPG